MFCEIKLQENISENTNHNSIFNNTNINSNTNNNQASTLFGAPIVNAHHSIFGNLIPNNSLFGNERDSTSNTNNNQLFGNNNIYLNQTVPGDLFGNLNTSRGLFGNKDNN